MAAAAVRSGRGVAETYQGSEVGAGTLTAPELTARSLKRYSVPFFKACESCSRSRLTLLFRDGVPFSPCGTGRSLTQPELVAGDVAGGLVPPERYALVASGRAQTRRSGWWLR